MVKRTIIGIILTALAAVGTYYCNMYTNLNDFPPNLLFGFSVFGACFMGSVVLVATSKKVFDAYLGYTDSL